MKRYKLLSLLTIVLVLFSSCNDFLERAPYDSIDENEYWQNENHIRIFSNGFISAYFVGYGTSGLIGGSKFGNGDTFNDDIAWRTQGEFTPIRVPETDGAWDFSYVKRANYMLEKIQTVPGLSEEALNHWTGVARLWRSMEYSDLTFLFGDVPYYDHVVGPEDYDELYKDRDSRTYVDQKIMEDFEYALANIRTDDGTMAINRYVAAAMVSRLALREGTFLKYHNIDSELGNRMIDLSRRASLIVMESGKFSISGDYGKLFTSEDLASNNEVIYYRHYVDGVLTHCTLTYNNAEAQTGANKALMESYLTSDGKPVYAVNPSFCPKTAEEFFQGRDPRMNLTFRDKYYIRGEDCSPFNYSTSGYSMHKFMNDADTASTDLKFRNANNVTDAPCLRYAEVLLNYAEACYELGNLTQADLDKSINLLRKRAGVDMPSLQTLGGQPGVNGVVYDDPHRDPDVPSLLWEIRRERRVELSFEGLRYNDLKRWKKFDYMCNATNPDIKYGAYIVYADYPKANKDEVVLENRDASEGYILCNTGTARQAPKDYNYVRPVPKEQITLYENHGYKLHQTKEWVGTGLE
ncbi:MAG: RagB/SusD family nutrient uptake outer membrane protein [Muribaculaceae bacterium]|nr:RagB/SusD family nutrient uptake outer membrane protein [Muribaculaceae bacterium]